MDLKPFRKRYVSGNILLRFRQYENRLNWKAYLCDRSPTKVLTSSTQRQKTSHFMKWIGRKGLRNVQNARAKLFLNNIKVFSFVSRCHYFMLIASLLQMMRSTSVVTCYPIKHDVLLWLAGFQQLWLALFDPCFSYEYAIFWCDCPRIGCLSSPILNDSQNVMRNQNEEFVDALLFLCNLHMFWSKCRGNPLVVHMTLFVHFKRKVLSREGKGLRLLRE